MRLTISKGLVELMGGEIWGEREPPGKGSIFCFAIEAEIAQDLPLDLEKSCKAVNIGNLAE